LLCTGRRKRASLYEKRRDREKRERPTRGGRRVSRRRDLRTSQRFRTQLELVQSRAQAAAEREGYIDMSTKQSLALEKEVMNQKRGWAKTGGNKGPLLIGRTA